MTEITCHAKGAWFLRPGVRTVIDIGGQDSKVICLDSRGNVENFVMNDKCAAGTGRFLEMMARTMELSLEEMSRRGLEWKEDINISSMCTVFAESEVVSLIARNTAVPDIIHGLNKAVAAKTAALARRLKARGPYMMTGGVARNAGVVRELEKRLGEKIYISEYAQLCGAVGAARTAFEKTAEINRRTNMRNDKVYYGIRIIAGIYVIYIACDTFRKVAAGETGENAVPLTAASIAILAAGIAFVIWGIVSLKKTFSSAGKGSAREETEAAEESPEAADESPEQIEEAAEEAPVEPEDESPEEEKKTRYLRVTIPLIELREGDFIWENSENPKNSCTGDFSPAVSGRICRRHPVCESGLEIPDRRSGDSDFIHPAGERHAPDGRISVVPHQKTGAGRCWFFTPLASQFWENWRLPPVCSGADFWAELWLPLRFCSWGQKVWQC